MSDTCSSRVNTTKSKLAEQVVVLGELVLALVDIDIKLGTVVLGSGDDLDLLDGISRATVEKFLHDAVDV